MILIGSHRQNGRELLAPYFNNITLNLYEDSLNVTEVNPLMDYLLSLKQVDSTDWEDGVQQARREVERVLAENGRYMKIMLNNGIPESDNGTFSRIATIDPDGNNLQIWEYGYKA